MGSLALFFCILVVVVMAVLVGPALVRRAKHNPPRRPLGMTKRQIAEFIDSIDLSVIGYQLRSVSGWESKRVQTALVGYRQFLFLTAINHREDIAPWYGDIDTIWLMHSQSAGYCADCAHLFGESLPYQDPKWRPANDGQRTNMLYEQTFRYMLGSVPENNENMLLRALILDELLNDPTPINHSKPPAGEFYVDPYASHGDGD